jgi:undecaprenyl-phosphate galactose phosphotransferase
VNGVRGSPAGLDDRPGAPQRRSPEGKDRRHLGRTVPVPREAPRPYEGQAPLRRSVAGVELALPVADGLALGLCFALGGLVNLSFGNLTGERGLILALLAAGALAAFHHFGHYARRRQAWQELGDIAAVAGVALVLDLALLYLLKVNFSRLWVLTSWALVVPALPLARGLAKRAALGLGGWLRPTVVVGAGASAREIAAAYDARRGHLGYQVQAFLDPSGGGGPDAPAGRAIRVGGREVPVLPLDPRAKELPGWLGRPHVVVALELDEMAGKEALVENLSFYHGDIDVVSPLRGLPINNTRVSHFFSRDLLALRIHNNLARPWPRLLKRAFDLAAAAALLAFTAPLLLLVALRVKLADGGAVVFAHTRVGRHGRPFRCYKFRTMVPNSAAVLAELLARDPAARAEWARDRKLKRDPRVTALGRFLRQTSLDELPQLVNVLKGEMSLVGPRPVVPDELELYGEAKVYYLQVRPGLTGLWQVSGRNDLDYARRVALDAWYVRNWTLWYDVLILCRTLLVVPAGQDHGAY